MLPTSFRSEVRAARAACRIGWTITSLVVVQGTAVGLSALPVVWLGSRLLERTTSPLGRLVVVSFGALPAYALFALLLLVLSPIANRLAGWQTPDRAEMRIKDCDWRLLEWVRYGASIHLARSLAGWLFRATPVWSAHLRLHGARIGRRVFINSLHLADYNLLEFNDDVVIGAEVHLSGHTVENGVVKTGGVRLGREVTIGVGAVIGIDVSVAAGSQVGAMSLVPKHTHLRIPTMYAGIPARRIA